MIRKMKRVVSNIYREHRYLLESEKIYPEEKQRIEKILSEKADKIEIEDSVLNCCEAAMERKIKKEEKLKKEPTSYII